MSGSSEPGRRRGVRVLGIGFGVVFVLLVVVAVVIYFGLRGVPAYYAQQQERINAMPKPQREAISENFFNSLLTKWSDADAGFPKTHSDLFGKRRTLVIPYEELNVWLAEKGIAMLADIGIKLPPAVKGAMVDSPGGGRLRLSCEVDKGSFQQVVAMTFEISVTDDGTVTSQLQGATAGRLPIPTSTAIDLIARRKDGGGRMLDLMQGTPVGPIELPIDETDSGRNGRLVGLEIRNDAMVITRETVRKPQTKP